MASAVTPPRHWARATKRRGRRWTAGDGIERRSSAAEFRPAAGKRRRRGKTKTPRVDSSGWDAASDAAEPRVCSDSGGRRSNGGDGRGNGGGHGGFAGRTGEQRMGNGCGNGVGLDELVPGRGEAEGRARRVRHGEHGAVRPEPEELGRYSDVGEDARFYKQVPGGFLSSRTGPPGKIQLGPFLS